MVHRYDVPYIDGTPVHRYMMSPPRFSLSSVNFVSRVFHLSKIRSCNFVKHLSDALSLKLSNCWNFENFIDKSIDDVNSSLDIDCWWVQWKFLQFINTHWSGKLITTSSSNLVTNLPCHRVDNDDHSIHFMNCNKAVRRKLIGSRKLRSMCQNFRSNDVESGKSGKTETAKIIEMKFSIIHSIKTSWTWTWKAKYSNRC